MTSSGKVYRYKVDGQLYELTRVTPEGKLQVRARYVRARPGDLIGDLILAPSEVDHVTPLSPKALSKVIELARAAFQRGDVRQARPGDLVFDPGAIHVSANAIGWLVDHGDAAVNDDGSGEVREVWDIWPLSGSTGPGGRPLRWENAEFVALPESVVGAAMR